MFRTKSKQLFLVALTLLLAVTSFMVPSQRINAADHNEATLAEGPVDIGDTYAFLDPNDNSKMVLALSIEGFIVPSELGNRGFFAEDVTYRFEVENTGDAKADLNIDVTFSKQTSRSEPQTATIKLPGGKSFTAKTTVANERATGPVPFTVTTDPTTKVDFFAGMCDDPFYFDIIGFNRFAASVRAGSPDANALKRGRDSFAGYNIHMIALDVPVSLLKGAGNVIGVNGVTLVPKKIVRDSTGQVKAKGGLIQVDRMATPAINTVTIPYSRKNEYNLAATTDDAAGKFANDIIASLKALGTNDANINILAGVAVLKGDILRVDITKKNTSLGEGENVTTPNYTGFPNGRRFGDDSVDTVLFFVANQNKLTDNVNKNDVPLQKTFPFVAPAHQDGSQTQN
ncbi:MAG: DUF4331 domain-containing protein [Blastocatellia bacterium]|nr:DUF4331 domain-containing protein [Blastocatellia bacterium]